MEFIFNIFNLLHSNISYCICTCPTKTTIDTYLLCGDTIFYWAPPETHFSRARCVIFVLIRSFIPHKLSPSAWASSAWASCVALDFIPDEILPPPSVGSSKCLAIITKIEFPEVPLNHGGAQAAPVGRRFAFPAYPLRINPHPETSAEPCTTLAFSARLEYHRLHRAWPQFACGFKEVNDNK
ncbi:MAG: hypothetical protein RL497_1572 [Pseudomonadota bacterium]